MEATHVLVRPAPRYEHPGQWFDPRAIDFGEPACGALTAPGSHDDDTDDDTDDGRATSTELPAYRQVHSFAVGAMTQVLEVLDRRRAGVALTGVVAEHVADQVAALAKARTRATHGPDQRPAAALRRVHVQLCGEEAAEVFGSYRRGDRVLAFAARVARVPVRARRPFGAPAQGRRRTEVRWQMTSLCLS